MNPALPCRRVAAVVSGRARAHGTNPAHPTCSTPDSLPFFSPPLGTHLVIMDELIHSARPERGAHDVDDGLAGVDVGDELCLALGGVGTLAQQHDLRLHHVTRHHSSHVCDAPCVAQEAGRQSGKSGKLETGGCNVQKAAMPGARGSRGAHASRHRSAGGRASGSRRTILSRVEQACRWI